MPKVHVTGVEQVAPQTFPWGTIRWLAGNKAGGGTEMTIGQVIIQPGQRNPLHQHPNCEEALFVVRGRIDHVVDGARNVPMVAGQLIAIPRGIKHQAINIGDEPAILMVSFSSADRQTISEP